MVEDRLFLCRGCNGEVAGFVHLGASTKKPEFHLYRQIDDPILEERERAYQDARRTEQTRQQSFSQRASGSTAQANGNGHHAPDLGSRFREQEESFTPEKRDALAVALGVPATALCDFRIGYAEKGPHRSPKSWCYTTAETNASGKVIGLSCRYPTPDEEGKNKKAWPGASRGLTVPFGWLDRPGPILLPEGMSDTAATTALGLAAVGRLSNTGGIDLLAELLEVVHDDREIIVLGELDPKADGSWPGRDGAIATAAELSRLLERPVSWAMAPDEAKDVRAWTVGQGLKHDDPADAWQEAGEKFLEEVQRLKQLPPNTAGSNTPPPSFSNTSDADDEQPETFEAFDDPHRLARLYLERYRVRGDDVLAYWREEWSRWDGSAYRPLKPAEVKAELTASVKAEFDRINRIMVKAAREKKRTPPDVAKVTTRLVANVAQALAGVVILPGSTSQPSWLRCDREPFQASEVLASRNRLVHLPSFVAGRPDYSCPPTPRFFSPNALSYDFRTDAGQPTAWLSFLHELWGDDAESIAALQEWFGYCLLPDTSQQKILFLVGPRRSGKGTIARVLHSLIGTQNVAAPTLGSLATNFGLQPLLGKMVATISDARISRRTDAAIVVERLLSISGEDDQTVDRKNLSAVTGRLPVRFTLLTNELPRLDDASGALVGRLILLRLTKSFFGKEDTRLTSRLLGELPSILLWAVEGWRRLKERGHFVQPCSAGGMVEQMENLASPIGAFIRECCEVGDAYSVRIQELFDRWKLWCQDNNQENQPQKEVFGRDLRAALPSIDVRQPRGGNGRIRVYVGIRVRQDEAEM